MIRNWERFETGPLTVPIIFQGLNDELKVVAGFQHAHLLGGAITTRHFRNGKELEPLMDDPYYDFNFQQFRPMVKERIIKPVISLIRSN